MIQSPAIILPQIAPLGTELEVLNDILEHTSLESICEMLQEKNIQVTAVETITAGVIGNLWLWVELSPYLSTESAEYWAAIGGGGGVIAPVAPTIIVPTGADGTVHGIMLPWAIHSKYARLVAQMPVAAAPLTAYWRIRAEITGKMP